VLEKVRALVEAGLPRAALNIALVTTRWGESHAVLLVATSEGEYVLDNLSPWIVGWREAPYHWTRRQVDGEAFSWVMVDDRAQPRTPAAKGLLIASTR
jgi:predicted transglutaminase-like cysteine proteinase